MVSSCSAYGCTNRYSKEKKIQFHRFPLENPQLLKKWVIAMRRASWQPTKFSLLCSDHFTRESYKSTAHCYLKDDAVPTIFNFSPNSKKNVAAQRVITKHESPPQQCENLQVPLDTNICTFVQNCIQDSQDENENISQTVLKNTYVSSTYENMSDNLNCSNKNNDSLDTQSRTVSIPSSVLLSAITSCLQNPATSKTEVASSNTDSYRIMLVPSSSKYEKSGPTKQQLLRKIKALRQQVRQRDMKIRRLETVIAHAKEIAKMSYKTEHFLPSTIGSVEPIVDEVENSSVEPQGQRSSCQFILKGRLSQSKTTQEILGPSAYHVLYSVDTQPVLTDLAL